MLTSSSTLSAESLHQTFVAFLKANVWTQGLAEESLRIPMPEAGSTGLEAFMVRPDDSGPHPLASLTHGTPREAARRADITALTFVPQSREFARRGTELYTVSDGRYRAGAGSLMDVLNAKSSLESADEKHLEAIYDLRESKLTLLTAVGRLRLPDLE